MKKGDNTSYCIATLLTCIGPEGRTIYDTCQLEKGEKEKIKKVLEMFTMYVTPLANIPYERCIFNTRNQKESETFDQYLTELRKLSSSCKFDTITPDEILRDRLILGLMNEKIKKRLLKDNELTLLTLIRICQSEEINLHQNNILYTVETVHQMKKSYQKKSMYSKDVQRSRNDSNKKQIKKLS